MEDTKKEEYFRGFDDDIEQINLDDFDEKSEEESKEETKEENATENAAKSESQTNNEETKDSTEDSTNVEEGQSTETKEESNDSTPKEEEKTEETTKETVKEAPKEESQTAKNTKNSYFAELRRAKEAREKEQKEAQERAKHDEEIRKKAELDTKLKAYKTNTFTNQPITDEEDLKVFEIQKAIEDKGGDPIGDLPKELARINRESIAKANEEKNKQDEAKKQNDEKVLNDVNQFRESHPDVNTQELVNNEEFQAFANGKFGRWTLNEIYDAFNEKKAQETETKKQKEVEVKTKPVVKEAAKKMSTVPSSNPNSSNQPKDWLSMSDEEYLKVSARDKDFF